jgi:hypothetical protein
MRVRIKLPYGVCADPRLKDVHNQHRSQRQSLPSIRNKHAKVFCINTSGGVQNIDEHFRVHRILEREDE